MVGQVQYSGNWLVTGGAGYIGQHLVRGLIESGRSAVVLDDLSTGRSDLLPPGVPLVVGDIAQPGTAARVLGDARFDGVLHLAALKSVEESVSDPLRYFRVNVEGTRNLLAAMADNGVRSLIYSSSAAVYGEGSDSEWVDEQVPPHPVNPYGQTKLAAEWMCHAEARTRGMSCVALRYFNVAGTASDELADSGERNLVPLAVRALLAGRFPTVFGNDYPTPDGSCVRDYIHVSDLVAAHLAAVDLVTGRVVQATYNVGTGRGYSVLEVLAALQQVSGRKVEPAISGRRAGDPATLVARTDLIERDLGWKAKLGIDEIVGSAWGAALAKHSFGSAPIQ